MSSVTLRGLQSHEHAFWGDRRVQLNRLASTQGLPNGIAQGPDGNGGRCLWFTEKAANKIGRITTAGAITEFALPRTVGPGPIAEGSDGNMWFTSNALNKQVSVGRVDRKTGEIKFLKLMAKNGLASTSHGMARDAKGNLWFDINTGNQYTAGK